MSNYDTDIVSWSEQQASLLRRIVAGEPVNETPDWENIVEELEDVGRSYVRTVESLLYQALVHILKCRGWPLSLSVPGWQAEARGFRAQARRAYLPSVRQKIDLAALYADALERIPSTLDGYPPEELPRECPYSLDQILANDDHAPARQTAAAAPR